MAGLLARGARTAADVAAELDLPQQRVRRHLNRLAAAGIASVEADRKTYRLSVEVLREAAREAGPPREPGLALGAVFEEEERVLRQYFRAGRLTEVPAKLAKRRIVLERLALEFEVGIRYPEREVNATLRRFHDDYATLRRYLVDEGLLSRERSVYWRSGGRVDLD